MIELLTVSVVVLWVLVIALVVVVFALIRQVGVLYERLAPAGALMINQAVAVGDAAPEIAIETLDGSNLVVGKPHDRSQLLFFVAPDCPICKSLLPVIRSVSRFEGDVDVVLISDGGTEVEHQQFVRQHGLEAFDYAISEIVGRAYGVGKLPYAVLIDGRGIIAALGIVNSREHLESLFEAERLGVASIQEYLNRADASNGLHYDAARAESPDGQPNHMTENA